MPARRLLYLQNSSSRASVTSLDTRFEDAGLRVDRVWAFNNEFPADLGGYDGIFLSGSPHGAYEDLPFIHREHELIVAAKDCGIPMLGVCFGHQILASALCGRDQVFRRKHCEVGYTWLDVDDAAMTDEICANIHPRFRMFVWHNDEVRADHPDLRVMASTDECPNQIFRYRDLPIWGIQGHPEVTRANAQLWFEDNRADLEADGADVDELLQSATDALAAKTLLDRFTDIILE